jgi:hypothetical protein
VAGCGYFAKPGGGARAAATPNPTSDHLCGTREVRHFPRSCDVAMFQVFSIAALLACSTLLAQDSGNMILAAGRSGVVELINPSTLETVGRILFDLGPRSAGLNGVYASADGSVLYVEGPIQTDPHGCCSLYSIDLATLELKLAASIPGSRSRNSFVVSDGLVYLATAFPHDGIAGDMRNDRLHFSPDGRWLFGVKSFRGPVLDMFDVAYGQVVRQLTPEGLEGDWWPTGTWSGNRFYLYASNLTGAGRLWPVSPEMTELGAGTAIAPFGRISGCAGQSLRAIVASAGNLFIHEQFGFKLDRRNGCAGSVPGGAMVVDPATGQVTREIAPNLHFSALVSDRTGSELYGLSAEDPNWELPAELVRIDPNDGRIMQSRHLDRGFWRMTVAPLRVVPSGDVRLNGLVANTIRIMATKN